MIHGVRGIGASGRQVLLLALLWPLLTALVPLTDIQVERQQAPVPPQTEVTAGAPVTVRARLVPEPGVYSALVDALKSGDTLSVVQYAHLKRRSSGQLVQGERRFTLRYIPAENTFKVAMPGRSEASVAGESTLQDLMFDVRLPLEAATNASMATEAMTPAPTPLQAVRGVGRNGRLKMGVSWEVGEGAAVSSRSWLDWLTLRPLWQQAQRIEGEAEI